MPKANYSAEAERDLGEIVDYISLDNVQAAETWLREIRTLCDLLASQPGIGQLLQTRRFVELRRHVTGKYLIYFLPTAAGIEVVRVVHGAREQNKLLER